VKSGNVTLDSRSVRIVIGVGVAFLVWMFCMLRLSHRCFLGYKWFEHYRPIVIGILSALCIVFVRQLWLAFMLAVVLGLAFFEAVIPPCLDWIHGPNRPRFPDAEARGRVLEDLRLIDAAIDAAQPTAATPKPTPK
jgi:hypothetical protein